MKDHITRNLKKILEDLDLCKKFARLKTKEEVYRFLSHMDENITKEEFNKWLEDNMNNKRDLLSVNELKKIAGGKSISKRVLSASLAALTLGAPGISAKGESKTFSSIQNSNTSIYRKLLFAGAAALGIPTAGLGAYILQKAVKDNALEAKNSPPKKNLGSGGTTGNTEISGYGWPGGHDEDYTSKPFSGIYNQGNTCFANGLFQCLHSIPNLKEKLRQDYLIQTIKNEPNFFQCKMGQLEQEFLENFRDLKNFFNQNKNKLNLNTYTKMIIDEFVALNENASMNKVCNANFYFCFLQAKNETDQIYEIATANSIIQAINNAGLGGDKIKQQVDKMIELKRNYEEFGNRKTSAEESAKEAEQVAQDQKHKLLYTILNKMDEKDPKILETKELARMSIEGYYGGQEDVGEFFDGLNLPYTILNLKLLENFNTKNFEDDLKPKIFGDEDAFLVKLDQYNNTHKGTIKIPSKLKQDGNKFKLVCIAIHNGSSSGGHYYAYRKDTKGNTGWWKCNDNKVEKACTDDNELLNKLEVQHHATLLTYVKDTQQDNT